MDLYAETEAKLKELRQNLPDCSSTARSIDQCDDWEDIAFYADEEGYYYVASWLYEAVRQTRSPCRYPAVFLNRLSPGQRSWR
ncbi:hypothetical protein [Thermithiobacillus plumbiphilus]|uniref:Uncharacterized protein n=1 Tax=Thermithiobacillus plumbiphilus TaxID=1729899 RepID=A0ABU9D940_9PROT